MCGYNGELIDGGLVVASSNLVAPTIYQPLRGFSGWLFLCLGTDLGTDLRIIIAATTKSDAFALRETKRRYYTNTWAVH